MNLSASHPKANRIATKIYWFKKLGILDICLFSVRNIFSRTTAYYDEVVITLRTHRFLQWLRMMGMGRKFLPITLDFNAKDERGLSLIYRATENLNQLADWFLSTHFPRATEREKQMVVTYLRGYIDEKIQFITLINERIKRQSNVAHVLCISPSPMGSMITDFFALKGVTIKSSLGLPKNLRQRLVPFAYFWLVLKATLFPHADKTNITYIRPAVWVEFYYPWRNEHAFWRHHITGQPFDLVYYLDRDDTPLTQETAADIEKSGMKWIDAHLMPIIRMSRLTPRKTWAFLMDYLHLSHTLPRWFRVFRFQEWIWYSIYASVFKRYQVTMLFQHQDRGWKQAVQAKAMEATNGIMVGYHWSNLPYCMEHWYLTSQHIYFVWGNAMRACLDSKINTCDHIIPSGIWIKPNDGRPEELDGLSDNLDYVLSIFDSDVGHYLMMTPETLSQFFLKILSLLEKHPRWGAILKSKSSSLERYTDLLPRGREIVDRLKALKKHRRFVALPPKYSPMTAMAHSHLGVCYCINTAGIASGIYGHRAIHWECVGLSNPIYADPSQQILYRSLDALGHAILRAAEGDKTIGDFSKWRKQVNYFDDYAGDRRVAWFIQTFMASISQTGDYKKSMDDSVAKYTNHYQVGEDFSNP